MSSDEVSEKKNVFGEPGAFQPGDGNIDAERRGSTNVQGRKMSRIGPPPKGSISLEGDGVIDEHSKLVALEEGNGIQYRTCSWQMVRYPSQTAMVYTIRFPNSSPLILGNIC